MAIFIVLLTLHFICDYPLQGSFLAEWKQKNNYLLFVHSFIWSGGIMMGLLYFNIFYWWKFLFLIIGHFIVDYWKCRGVYKKHNLKDMESFYIDQSIHFVQVLMVSFI